MLSSSNAITFPTARKQKTKIGFGCGREMFIRVRKLPAINTQRAANSNSTPVMVGPHRMPPEPFKRLPCLMAYPSRLNVSSTPLRLIVGHMNVIPIITREFRYLNSNMALELDLKPVG